MMKKEQYPKVSFVTAMYREPQLIRVLLRGIEQADFDFPFEYLLVDNGCDETSEQVRKRFPWVNVFEPKKNLGFAGGNNLAFQNATGEYIMLVNPDLTVFPGEMEKLITFADGHPHVAFFGPRIENPNGMRQESCTRYPSFLMPAYQRTLLGRTPIGKRAIHRHFMRDVSHDAPHQADCLYGSAILIRRDALEQIGYFDERFFMYYEDVDLCRRARQNGYGVMYTPVARFVHYHKRQSVIRGPWELLSNRLTRIHIASALKYFWKYRSEAIPS